ncbi:hypothetical protein MMC21_008320 [Puttea exsequens]|nr:hypothetical protein [Puttea exsequens]
MRLVDPASETYSTQVKGMGCDSSTTLLSTPIVPSQHLKVAQQQQRRKTSLPHSPEPPTKLSLPPHLASDDYGSKAVVHLGEILRDRACTHERAFEAYSVLPSPGVSLLSQHDLRLLFHRMSVMEKKDRPSKLRYMSVVEDMKEASLPMIEAEWNSAIAFCGQCFARISAVDVREAYNTWQEMEQKAKVKSGHVTFTILFDLAAKAGKLLLAEEILKRMEARGLGFDRYGRASFMYYHGIKGDGQGVRRAWFDFLEAGEIPDTVVVNCLIASLIRAGEPAQAELVYERMKRVFSQHTGHALPRSDWREIRSLGRVLARSAVRHRNHLVEVEKSRNEQYLIPNVHTYAIFVEYYASSTGTGEILPVSAKLHEMRELGLEMDGRIFTKLFKGFANHGKKSYTKWTIDYLERVWASLLNLLNQETDVKVARWMVVWVIRAFETCADQHRTKEIWHELLKWWSPQPGELKMVLTVLKMQG